MSNPASSPPHSARARTRAQLLAAAREIFAEAGFRHATIREISRRAGANIAAVNYHFGSKRDLYAAAVRDAARLGRETYPEHFGLDPDPTPEQRLHAFVRSLLLRTLSPGPQSHHGRLLTRELFEPSPVLPAIVREDLEPMAKRLIDIVQDLAGRKASPEFVRQAALSVVAQIVFHFQSRPVLQRMFADLSYEVTDIERLADHISSFSLAAIKGLASKRKKPR